jgi:2,3-bisphosphoglycerate-dependent phosphoglycerate mutase
MKLYFVRHGESHTNVTPFDQLPSMDMGLTDKGHAQAAALRDWMIRGDAKADALYSSSLQRARQTAAYLQQALGIAPIEDDRLREIGSNDLSGLSIAENNLPRLFHERWVNESPFVSRAVERMDVESWMHFRIRLARFVDELAQKHLNQTVYVVTHGGTMSAMFDNVFNIGPYRRCDVHNLNTSWTMFEYRTETNREPWYLWFHNRIDHLAGIV